MTMFQEAADMLLRNAIGVIPVALVVAGLCKAIRFRPATRHLLWLGVLVFLIIPPTLPEYSRSLLQSVPPAAQTTVASPTDQPNASIHEALIERTALPETSRTPEPALRTRAHTDHQHDTALPVIEPSKPLRRMWPTDPFGRIVPDLHVALADSAPNELIPAATQTSDMIPTDRAGYEMPRAIGAIVALWNSGSEVASELGRRVDAKVESALERVRTAVGAIPAFPAWLWVSGVLAVLVTALVRLHLAARLFRSAETAPAPVQLLVSSASREIGLRRSPRTLMVEDRVSPMVWCGARATLVLPRSLWSELDDTGRRAVVQHELAHLRRKDHWVRWAELIVGTLYWWHPVVWWARKKVREEADLSCDLWVTSLTPSSRAPYARALLMTKQYVSAGGAPVPPVGIGAVSAGAKRFSRRITMVMTTRMNPRTSIVGVALAATLVLGGVYAAPTWACDKAKSPTAAKAPKAEKAPKAPKDGSDLSTFEQYMIEKAPEHVAPAPPTGQRSSGVSRTTTTTTSSSCSPSRAPMAIGSAGSIDGRVQAIVSGQAGYSDLARLYTVGDDREFTATYTLPQDRLKGLVKLMSREDVPLLIEPLDNGIVVHGNAEQQRRFAAFVALLDPKVETVTYNMNNRSKLKDLTDLMALNSVPTYIYKGEDTIRVKGDTNVQRAFSEFFQMIDPGSSGEFPSPGVASAQGLYQEHPLRSEAAKVEMRVRGMHAEAERLRAIEETLRLQAEQVEEQAESLEEQAEHHREQAESILEHVESALEEVEDFPDAARYEAMVEAEASQNEAHTILQLADMIESQIEMVLAQIEPLMEQAERCAERADELEEQAEELAESLESQIEELESELENRFEEFNDWASEHSQALRSLLEEHAERLDQELSQRMERLAR